MTVFEASERLAREVESRGHFTVSLLIQVHPREHMDRYPPPGEAILTRLQRWLRRRFQASHPRIPRCHCCPVSGVTLDEAEGEFLLWLEPPPVASLTSAKMVGVGELHQVLAAYCPNHGHYQMEAAVYWREANARRQIPPLRLDWPVLGIGVDDSSGMFGFVAGPGWNPPGATS